MKIISYLALILSISFCGIKYIYGAEQNTSNVFGNSDIDSYEELDLDYLLARFDYIASLRNDKKDHICGGTIISPRTILTAAHCVDRTNLTYVVVGTYHLNASNEERVFTVESSKAHPKYDKNTLANDIAVIITKDVMDFDYYVQSVQLPSTTLKEGDSVVALGWGLTGDFPANLSPDLANFKPKIISLEKCRTQWEANLITDSHICIYAEGQGFCYGDSGGPIVNDRRVYGIGSFGKPCGTNTSDVATSVVPYVSWIKTNMIS